MASSKHDKETMAPLPDVENEKADVEDEKADVASKTDIDNSHDGSSLGVAADQTDRDIEAQGVGDNHGPFSLS